MDRVSLVRPDRLVRERAKNARKVVPDVAGVERVLDEEGHLVGHVELDALRQRRRLGKVGQVLDREGERDGLCARARVSTRRVTERGDGSRRRSGGQRTCCRLILTSMPLSSDESFLALPFFAVVAAFFFLSEAAFLAFSFFTLSFCASLWNRWADDGRCEGGRAGGRER